MASDSAHAGRDAREEVGGHGMVRANVRERERDVELETLSLVRYAFVLGERFQHHARIRNDIERQGRAGGRPDGVCGGDDGDSQAFAAEKLAGKHALHGTHLWALL